MSRRPAMLAGLSKKTMRRLLDEVKSSARTKRPCERDLVIFEVALAGSVRAWAQQGSNHERLRSQAA